MPHPEKPLTNKLTQILQLAALGRTDKEIAAIMNVSPNTVESHWKRLRAIYNSSSRTYIVATALNQALKEALAELESESSRRAQLEDILGLAPIHADQNSQLTSQPVLAERAIVLFQITEGANDTVSESIAAFGYDHADFACGKLRLLSLVHPEDSPLLAKKDHTAMSPHGPAEETHLRYRLRAADGTMRLVEERSAPLVDIAGTVIGRHGAILDLTDIVILPARPPARQRPAL